MCCFRVILVWTSIALCGRLAWADELAWADVGADGSLSNWGLDVPVASARGAQNFFIENPMDSHDWAHSAAVRKSLVAVLPRNASGISMTTKIAKLQEALQPLVAAMPKDSAGRLDNGTARYVLHRFFVDRHGWSIKGLQPAGASWMATLSVTPDVKDITKSMVPTYLLDNLAKDLDAPGFDAQSLAVSAAAMDHLIRTEIVFTVYSCFSTLGLPIPGQRTADEVGLVLETYMMVYVFGLNLDVSMLDDVQRARSHLEKAHPAWPILREYASAQLRLVTTKTELSFDEVVQVAEKIGEGYTKLQGADCSRVKEELVAKPSHREGRVPLSDVSPSHAPGRRSLLTEKVEELEQLGVLSDADAEGNRALVIPNYLNSQSMCLATASFYSACCPNECEAILAVLERDARAPAVVPESLARALAALPTRPPVLPQGEEALLKELRAIADAESSTMVALHGRGFSAWMHKAFPLECSAPSRHGESVANPKTPDEWMGGGGAKVAPLEDMISEVAQALRRYTAMGEAPDKDQLSPEPAPQTSSDVIRIAPVVQPVGGKSQRSLVRTAVHLAALASLAAFAAVAAKSVFKKTDEKETRPEYRDSV